MNYESRPHELLRLVKPQQAWGYALAKGWRRVHGVNGEIALVKILKARAELGPDDYQKAVDAHRRAEPVKFCGVLHLGRRIHRVTDVRDFSVL